MAGGTSPWLSLRAMRGRLQPDAPDAYLGELRAPLARWPRATAIGQEAGTSRLAGPGSSRLSEGAVSCGGRPLDIAAFGRDRPVRTRAPAPCRRGGALPLGEGSRGSRLASLLLWCGGLERDRTRPTDAAAAESAPRRHAEPWTGAKRSTVLPSGSFTCAYRWPQNASQGALWLGAPVLTSSS
jgi:hypothetical protein